MQLRNATSECNFGMQLWNATSECNFGMQFRNAISECNFGMQLLHKMILPVYRMNTTEIWLEILRRLAVTERSLVANELQKFAFASHLPSPLGSDKKTGVTVLKLLRENNFLANHIEVENQNECGDDC